MGKLEQDIKQRKEAFWGIKKINEQEFSVFETLSAKLDQITAKSTELWTQLNKSILPALEEIFQYNSPKDINSLRFINITNGSGRVTNFFAVLPIAKEGQPANPEILIEKFRLEIISNPRVYNTEDNGELKKDLLLALSSKAVLKPLVDHLSSNPACMEDLCRALLVVPKELYELCSQFRQALEGYTWADPDNLQAADIAFLGRNNLGSLRDRLLRLSGSEECYFIRLLKEYKESVRTSAPLNAAADYSSIGSEDAIIRILNICGISTTELGRLDTDELTRKKIILELSRTLLENISGLPDCIANQMKRTYLSYIYNGHKNSAVDLNISDQEFFLELSDHLTNPKLWSVRLAAGPDSDLAEQAFELLKKQGPNSVV